MPSPSLRKSSQGGVLRTPAPQACGPGGCACITSGLQGVALQTLPPTKPCGRREGDTDRIYRVLPCRPCIPDTRSPELVP